jgi:hypothetical protein
MNKQTQAMVEFIGNEFPEWKKDSFWERRFKESPTIEILATTLYDVNWRKIEPDKLTVIEDDKFKQICVDYSLEICQSNPIKDFNITELCWRLIKAQLASILKQLDMEGK